MAWYMVMVMVKFRYYHNYWGSNLSKIDTKFQNSVPPTPDAHSRSVKPKQEATNCPKSLWYFHMLIITPFFGHWFTYVVPFINSLSVRVPIIKPIWCPCNINLQPEITAPDPEIHDPPPPFLLAFSSTGTHWFTFCSSNFPLSSHPTRYYVKQPIVDNKDCLIMPAGHSQQFWICIFPSWNRKQSTTGTPLKNMEEFWVGQ